MIENFKHFYNQYCISARRGECHYNRNSFEFYHCFVPGQATCGHLWEGRFYSCALDEEGLQLAAKYVELNPVRAKICRVPWQYDWSSAATHVGQAKATQLLNLSIWNEMISAAKWRNELADGIDDKQVGRIRMSTHSGRPLGTDNFVSKLEKLLGRRVRPLPVGRQPKKAEK